MGALPFYAPSHSEPLRATPSHSEPLRATPSHSEPLRATPNHSEPLRPIFIKYKSTPSHSDPFLLNTNPLRATPIPEVPPVNKNSPPPPESVSHHLESSVSPPPPESVSHHLESSVSPPPPESVSYHLESSVSRPPPESVSHPYREAVGFSSAQFLINALTNDPSRSEYYRSSPPKGMRTNYFYITDSSMADVTADDNGAYLKTRKTTRT